MKKRVLAAAAITGSVLLTAACGGGASTPKPSGQGVLAGVCPSTIVIQTDWYATPERAAAYQLVGPNGSVDPKKARTPARWATPA
ncbi:hypothetical protein ACFXG4_49215 [Nocardia sp. NPDC059246]|uniref:hypothetical protein n=1 Tax=unclassified Nocardia TaxID=2637762 RepID=UPI0036CAF746